MSRRARPVSTPLVIVVLFALAVGVLAGAAFARGKGPDLGKVPKVVKVRSKKTPPKNVRFRGEPVPGGITTGTGTAAGGTGEVIIPGVPGYSWRDGCGPTAAGMVIGYYDGQGWPDLIPGDATGVTPEVNQAIASHGTADAPRHYEDYVLPQDGGAPSPIDDRSEAPLGDEHASDSIADFMHTSWSADGLLYGWSYSNMIGPALTGYARAVYPGTQATSTTYAGSSLTWTLVKQEMNAGRPMVFLVDSSGDGWTDHFVTIVGYREVNGYPEYACWDTWSTTLLRWQRFRAMSASYAWGVWGGFTFSLGGTAPTPTATPTPTPSPSVPAVVVDTTAPMTSASGVDDAWHNKSVTVTFTATDAESGVAFTEYSLDGGAWTRGTSVTVAVPRKTASAVVHVLQYRSTDNAGNLETAQFAQVKIDSVKPVTASNADSLVHAGAFTLVLTPKDADSGVFATYYKVDSEPYQTGTAAGIAGAGRHTVRFYSIDAAGNVEATKSVTVRIS